MTIFVKGFFFCKLAGGLHEQLERLEDQKLSLLQPQCASLLPKISLKHLLFRKKAAVLITHEGSHHHQNESALSSFQGGAKHQWCLPIIFFGECGEFVCAYFYPFPCQFKSRFGGL